MRSRPASRAPIVPAVLLAVLASGAAGGIALLPAAEKSATKGVPPSISKASAIDSSLLAGMKARSIGPAGMSGRVAAIDAVASDPRIVYVGASTGGVWKSVNAGLTWEPIFDDQPVAAIGAVAIFQPSPDLVWVGTGEGNPRNSASVGDGVYRSLDGGRTWAHAGLAGSERIHRVVLHPADPDVAYAAALGPTWGESPERGVFRTTDGGRTWKKILYVNPTTGAGDLVMDPVNPLKLFAALWDHRRSPYSFRSGGPGSGLHVTHDGGETWTRLAPADGLPEGELGRIGVAIAPSDPNVVYALIEGGEIALYASRDGGRTWEKAGSGPDVGNRPFYYADIRVDPRRPDRVYSLWSMISVSDDGGRSFRRLVTFKNIHPDHHAMWINPAEPREILIGNDGGVAASSDRGETWRFAGNLPLAQYYHVRLDMDTPYNVYGGMQDNGSWRGPSSVWENGGIRNHHWEEVGFGDGFDTLPHPADSRSGYAMSQEGYLSRWDLRTGERKDIRPPAPEGVKLRFNWNAGIAQDPFEPDTIYYGSQFLHRSRDRGESWEILSGDLTTNNPEWQKQDESGGLTPDVTGAENYTTIIAIAPSPVEHGVIWVGTDDGRLHLTRDAGRTWTSLEDRLQGVPANTWIPHIEASSHSAATAFVVLDDHRRSSWTPYVQRTDDFGRSWKNIAGREIRGYALALVQDIVKEELLFLGTEFGLHVSQDGGRSWFKWTHGVPTVSVMDLAIHPRENDLVLGTHGRSAFVLDDIRPLRSITPGVLAEPLHLFSVPDAVQYHVKQTGASRFPGHGEFRGENRPYGALITFSLSGPGLPHPDPDVERARQEAARTAGTGAATAGGAPRASVTVTAAASATAAGSSGSGSAAPGGKPGAAAEKPKASITITDDRGQAIRTLEIAPTLGVNRAAWDLRHDPFKEPPMEESGFREPQGIEVLPGTYGVAVSFGDATVNGTVRVLADPRSSIPESSRRAKLDALTRAGGAQETLTAAVRRLHRSRDDIRAIRARLEPPPGSRPGEAEVTDPAHKELLDLASTLEETIGKLERQLFQPPGTKGIPAETDAQAKIGYVLSSLGSSWDQPTAAQMTYLGNAEDLLRVALAEVNRFQETGIADLRRMARKAGIGLLPEADPLTLPE